jgi:serine/threonine-protein kinase
VLKHRYRLDDRIALGGVGEVWRGTDLVLRRVVAVKLLRPEYAQDEECLARFRVEGRHAALLSAGAKIDAKNPFGDRPIMVAALSGHLAIVKKLLTRGAALDTPGWTPLIYAATNGGTEVVRYLLDAGAAIRRRRRTARRH